jgi:pimeloyl-ACP methyl ester carboxylesterase
LTPAYFSRALAELVPAARLALPRGGHLIPQTEPVLYNAALEAFL